MNPSDIKKLEAFVAGNMYYFDLHSAILYNKK